MSKMFLRGKCAWKNKGLWEAKDCLSEEKIPEPAMSTLKRLNSHEGRATRSFSKVGIQSWFARDAAVTLLGGSPVRNVDEGAVTGGAWEVMLGDGILKMQWAKRRTKLKRESCWGGYR